VIREANGKLLLRGIYRSPVFPRGAAVSKIGSGFKIVPMRHPLRLAED
jgi:hypothetical protein